MSSQEKDEQAAAIEATRERRKAVAEQGRNQPRSERTSKPTETPKQKASKGGNSGTEDS